MPIQSVEIICIPCSKCANLEQKIRDIVKTIAITNKAKIVFEVKTTIKLTNLSNYSLNSSQTPAILINGNVEIAGRVDLILLKRRLTAIQGSC